MRVRITGNKKTTGLTGWTGFFLALGILFAFVVTDIVVLGRNLPSTKSKDPAEYFKLNTPPPANSNKPPYTHITSVVMVAPEDMVKPISVSNDPEQCKDSCTFDDQCVAYTFDKIYDKCKLLYDITGYVNNKDGLFTTSGGQKLRHFLGENNPDKKYLRFEEMELPPEGKGKLATHQFVRNVNDCKTKCLEINDARAKCIAFEYDFNNKVCTLNEEVSGKIAPNPHKDTYVMIN